MKREIIKYLAGLLTIVMLATLIFNQFNGSGVLALIFGIGTSIFKDKIILLILALGLALISICCIRDKIDELEVLTVLILLLTLTTSGLILIKVFSLLTSFVIILDIYNRIKQLNN